MPKSEKFKDIKVVDRKVRVRLEYIGEGWSGDYQPDDPEDTPLVRFSVQRKVGRYWEDVNDSSYCTCIPISTLRSKLIAHAEKILSIVGDDVRKGESIKKTCERLTWVQL